VSEKCGDICSIENAINAQMMSIFNGYVYQNSKIDDIQLMTLCLHIFVLYLQGGIYQNIRNFQMVNVSPLKT